MSDTESYLLHVKNDFLRRASAVFLLCLTVTAVSFATAYAVACLFGDIGTFQILDPIPKGNISVLIKSALTSQFPLAAQLVLLLLSVFTLANKWVTFALCAWRGVCFGSAVRLLTGGKVLGLGNLWELSLAVYFVTTVLFIILAAISSVYSCVFVYTTAIERSRYTASIFIEYIKYFLIISGGIFLLGCVTVILI